jgi:membrane fusion protein (multidrug efflux system)
MPEDNKMQDHAGNNGGNSSSGQGSGNGQSQNNGQENNKDNKQDKQEDKKPMDPAKKRRLIVIGVLAGIVLIVGVVAWLIYSSTYTTTDDAQVDGHLDSIASRVNGTVIGVYAENNQPVKAGQLLVKLDPKDLEATAEQSKAKYEQAVAKLAMDFPNVPIQENTNIGTTDSDLASVMNAQAALEGSQRDYDSKVSLLHQAEAASEKAQKDLVRYKKLLDKREVAPSDYDQYVSTDQQNVATVESDRHSAESAAQTVLERKAQLQQQQVQLHQDQANAPHQTAMKKSQLDSDKASIAAARAQYDSDMLNLSYTEIHSPVEGIASQRNAEMASRVNAAQQVMVIVQTQDQWITANFKETQLKKMRVGQHVNITVDALGREFTGTVEYMPAATGDRDSLFPPENATGNYVKVVQRLPVRVRFDPNQAGLDEIRPGMSAEARVNF